jgi:hypothetical protein
MTYELDITDPTGAPLVCTETELERAGFLIGSHDQLSTDSDTDAVDAAVDAWIANSEGRAAALSVIRDEMRHTRTGQAASRVGSIAS